jgi:hypothetical protein
MSNESLAKDFILLYRGGVFHKDLSPDQMQQIVRQYTEWVDLHRGRGQFLGGKPLEAEGKVVSGKNGQLVSDGPFMESKEVIVGFTMIRAANLAAAVEIAKGSPILNFGGMVEVRPVLAGNSHGSE